MNYNIVTLFLLTFISIYILKNSYSVIKNVNLTKIILIYSGATAVFGYFLMPFSLAHYKMSFWDSSNYIVFSKSVNYFILSFFSMLFVVYILDLLKFRLTIPKYFIRINNSGIYLFIVYCFIMFSIAGLMYIYIQKGISPIKSFDPISAKFYLFADNKIIATLAIRFLSFSNVLLIAYFIYNKKIKLFPLLMFVLSNYMLLTSMKRSPLLLPYFFLLVAMIIVSDKVRIKYLVSIIIIIIIGVGMWYIGAPNLQSDKFLNIFSSNVFVEPRELGRILLHFSDGTSLYCGKTFIAGLLNFIPSSQWYFKEKFYIVRVVANILGIDYEKSGVPRIGLVGESYLNFDLPGIVIISIIFILCVRLVNNFYLKIRNYNVSKNEKLFNMIFFAVILKDLHSFIGSGSSAFLFIYINMLMVFILFIFRGIKIFKIND